MRKREYLVIEKWEDDYNGAGIYSLVAEDGRRYIGQAKHVQDRLLTHNTLLNRVSKGLIIKAVENENLMEIAAKGGKLKVEILYKIPWSENSRNMRFYYEDYYCNLYKTTTGVLNIAPIYAPNWHYEPSNDIELEIELEEDIIKYLENIEDVQTFIKDLIRADIQKRVLYQVT